MLQFILNGDSVFVAVVEQVESLYQYRYDVCTTMGPSPSCLGSPTQIHLGASGGLL